MAPETNCKLSGENEQLHSLTLRALQERSAQARDAVLEEMATGNLNACAIKESLSTNVKTNPPILDRNTVAKALSQGIITSLIVEDRERASELMQHLWKNMPSTGTPLYLAKAAEYLYLSTSQNTQEQELVRKKVPELMYGIRTADTEISRAGTNTSPSFDASTIYKIIPKNFRSQQDFRSAIVSSERARYAEGSQATTGDSSLKLHHIPQVHLLSTEPDPKHVVVVGFAQLALLRRLDELKPVVMLDESMTDKLGAETQRKIRESFRSTPEASRATSEQLGLLAEVGAGRIYRVLNPSISYIASQSFAEVVLGNIGMKNLLASIVKANADNYSPEKLEQTANRLFNLLDHTFRESQAMEQIKPVLAKFSTGNAVVIFGGAHDFSPTYKTTTLLDSFSKKVPVVISDLVTSK